MYMILITILRLVLIILAVGLLLPANASSPQYTPLQNSSVAFKLPITEAEKQMAFNMCVAEQRLGFYAKKSSTNGIPIKNVIKVLSVRYKRLPKGQRIPVPILKYIVSKAYTKDTQATNIYRFTYEVFSECMDRNKLDPIRYLKNVREA